MDILMTSLVDLKNSQHNRPYQFLKYLSKKHNLTVISFKDCWKSKQSDLTEYTSEFNAVLDDVDYYYLTNRNISPVLQELFFTKKIKKLSKKDFDVHLNYNSLILGYRISENFKTVFDIADDLTAMIHDSPQINGLFKGMGANLGRIYLNRNIRNSKYVTVTTKNLLKTCDIPPEKAVTIPNGVNTTLFKKHNNAKEKLNLEGFLIGYVGVLREWVDFKPLFKALRKLDKDIKLVIVGKEGKFKENMKLAKDCGVSERVIFIGMVPYSQVPLYVSAMDICVIPFKVNSTCQNALPLKLFEYMACEKPVISTNLDTINTFCGDKVLYVLNEQDYIDKISYLYENKELRTKMGKEGRKFIKDYEWEQITDKLEKVLINAAN